VRKLLPLLFAGLFLTPPLMSQAAPPSADEQALRGIETEIAKLEQQNDSTFAKFFAKGWICLGPTRVLSKSEFVENVRLNFITHERAVNPCTVEKKNMQVHVFVDTAVVTYVKEYHRRRTPQNSSTKTIPMSLPAKPVVGVCGLQKSCQCRQRLLQTDISFSSPHFRL
jgi:hypothetical protein